jgi:conjugation system TraG family ATPase
MRGLKNLEDVFPVWKIEKDCLLNKMGSVSVAFSVILPEIFTLASSDYEAMHAAWVRAIKVLPVGSILHKQDWFLQASYDADFDNTSGFLSVASNRHFHERPWLNHECYLYISFVPAGRFTANALSSTLTSSSLVPIQCLDQKALQEFLDRVGQFAQVLSESGSISLRRLTSDELASNESKAGLLERYSYLLAEEDPRMVSDILLGDQLQVGDKHCQVFTLADIEALPAACGPRINYENYSSDVSKFSIGFASPISLLLNCNHIYNQYVLIEDVATYLKKQEKRRLRLQSLSAYSRENTISREGVNQYLNEAIALGRMPVKSHFNLLCFSTSLSEMREIKNKVSAALAEMDAGVKLETDCAAQLYWAGIPGNAAGLPVHECFDTFIEQAACFFTAETNYDSSGSTFGLRLGDRLTGKPLQVDLSDDPLQRGIITNRNKFVLGPTGSGKSVFCNHLVRSYVEQGAHAVLVDVGHSYKGLCELLEGKYFTYSTTEPISFNPFYFEGDLDTEKKESIKSLLLALWKKEDEPFTRSEYVALSSALSLYFETNISFPCFNSFYEFLENTFSKKLEADRVKEKDFDLSNLLYVLRPYYRGGEYDFLLNAKENLDLLNQRMIVFELDNIKDHPILLPVVTLIIMELFISKMRKLQGVRKIILIEEAWKAIARNGMAEYIKYLFKTVRKFFGEAIIVTQDVEDIIHSPIVKNAIIHSSDCKILLDQSKYLNNFEKLQSLLSLTDKEKTLLFSMEKATGYKNVFISLGGTISKVYRIELSLEEKLAYTTEEKEKMWVQAFADKYGSVRQGIKMLANHIREQNKKP